MYSFCAGILSFVVYPYGVSLALFDAELTRMLSLRGKVESIPELPVFIETLTEFHKSMEDVKYKFFDELDRNKDVCMTHAKKAVKLGSVSGDEIEKTDVLTGKAEEKLINEIKKAFDLKIKRAKDMLYIAKELQKFFNPKR